MSTRPVLHGYWRSSATWRVRLALNLKEIEYEYHSVHLVQDGGEQWKSAYRELNPASEVPTLEIDGVVLAQSLAIIEYLDETRPAPALLPTDPVARARVRQLAEQINASTQPLQNLRVLLKLRDDFAADQSARDAWAAHYIRVGLEAYEALLERCSGRYSVGDEISMADCCLIPQVYNADRFGVDLSPMPRIRSICMSLSSHPAVVAAHPDVQPDAPSRG
jgi:maleylacetoacetate isomerase